MRLGDEDAEVCLALKAGKLAALNVYELLLAFTPPTAIY